MALSCDPCCLGKAVRFVRVGREGVSIAFITDVRVYSAHSPS